MFFKHPKKLFPILDKCHSEYSSSFFLKMKFALASRVYHKFFEFFSEGESLTFFNSRSDLNVIDDLVNERLLLDNEPFWISLWRFVLLLNLTLFELGLRSQEILKLSESSEDVLFLFLHLKTQSLMCSKKVGMTIFNLLWLYCWLIFANRIKNALNDEIDFNKLKLMTLG